MVNLHLRLVGMNNVLPLTAAKYEGTWFIASGDWFWLANLFICYYCYNRIGPHARTKYIKGYKDTLFGPFLQVVSV